VISTEDLGLQIYITDYGMTTTQCSSVSNQLCATFFQARFREHGGVETLLDSLLPDILYAVFYHRIYFMQYFYIFPSGDPSPGMNAISLP
jgi:hypothetical protein